MPWPEFPVNEGALCRKGWIAVGLRGNRARLTTPLVRDRATGGCGPRSRTRRSTWSPGSSTGCGTRPAPTRSGCSVAGGLTNEKAYQLAKFARVALGTSQIDYNGRWCMSSAASAANQAFGVDRGLPFPLADLEQTDVLVLVGSNLAETMPPAARHLDRLREQGGKVVVIDPRYTATAERADLFLQPVPGTDLPLALGLLHLLDAAGAVDEEYVAARTTGFDAVRRTAAAWWPERVERVSGVPTSELRVLAGLLAGTDRAIVLTARGAEQHSQGTATVLSWVSVALGTPDGARALLVFGSNIVVSAPNATHVRERLESLDLLVVADIVMSDIAAMADVVLPVTQWSEETGTMTNLEGRVSCASVRSRRLTVSGVTSA